MLLILLFNSIVASEKVDILPSYCVDEDSVYLKDLNKNILENDLLFKLPQNATNFKTTSAKVVDILQQKGYDVEDKSNGIITFKRYCDTKNSLKIVYLKLQKAFEKIYPNVIIDTLKITPKNPLPNDFRDYILRDINIAKAKLRRSNGTFVAHYTSSKGLTRNIYLRFDVKARLPVFKALYDIKRGDILSYKNYDKNIVPLRDLPYEPLQIIPPNLLEAKFNIKQNTILSKRQFKKRLLLKKGSLIQAYLRDGVLTLQVEAKALDGGNRGDIIRIRTNEGKSFNAMVESEKSVLIK